MMIFAHFCIRGLNSKVAAILAASLEISWQPFYAPIGCTFFHSTWAPPNSNPPLTVLDLDHCLPDCFGINLSQLLTPIHHQWEQRSADEGKDQRGNCEFLGVV